MKSAITLLCLFCTAFCASQPAGKVGSIEGFVDDAVESTKKLIEKTVSEASNPQEDVDFSKKINEILDIAKDVGNDAKAYVKQNEVPVELAKVLNETTDAIDKIVNLRRSIEPTKSGIIKMVDKVIESAKEIQNMAQAASENEDVDGETAKKLEKIAEGAQKVADLSETLKNLLENNNNNNN